MINLTVSGAPTPDIVAAAATQEVLLVLAVVVGEAWSVVLIRQKVLAYKEILSRWSKFGKRLQVSALWLRDISFWQVSTVMEEDELLADPQLYMDIGWQLMQVV
ncbi:hypothetical protein PIB30_007147 [Stylosanthes scabra]|uniref:Uncharacterized protein n=1 Tax=Stylosanthes scabra TaxID=79078 RepID=A0ABU6T5L3_9FABA|nr:hypothetical protein [Stylosanthes scabra]